MRTPTQALVLALALASMAMTACADQARLPQSAGEGPSPRLPPPSSSLMPTVNVAKAVGWPQGASATPATDLVVTAFARDLDHPRWLHVLPNGDELVAESNAPPRPADAPSGGLKG